MKTSCFVFSCSSIIWRWWAIVRGSDVRSSCCRFRLFFFLVFSIERDICFFFSCVFL